MSTNAKTTDNATTHLHSNDFDGFVDQAPYCYSWTTNDKGVKVPVFPYVISILGHLNLKKLGIASESEKQATELMKKTLEMYLEQVVKQWHEKHFWQKKIDFPLIILINIADKIGELVTDVVESLQKKYPFIRLIAVLPLPKNEFIKSLREDKESPQQILEFENRCNQFTNDADNDNQKYLWELSDKEMPHIAEQPKLKKWRMFNEFVASHSHLMIVFWQGEKDNWKEQDDSLTWAIRYKLEGYPGLSRNEETDLITYPATGPVLHIQTDAQTIQETIEKPNACLPVHFYSDRAIITKEVDGERKLIISDPKFLDLEQLRHSWFNKKLADVGKRPEILHNCEILKELNYTCLDQSIPLKNPSLRSFIEDFVIKKYEKSEKIINKEDIPETDNPTGQFIAHYSVIDSIADFYEEKTRRLINAFCRTFLILLILNAFLIFLNDLCNMGFGVNAFKLTLHYTTEWIPNHSVNDDQANFYFWEKLGRALVAITPNKYLKVESHEKLDDDIEKEQVKVSRILGLFLVTLILIPICISRIIYFCCLHFFKSWHYKYHQFRMLADCLRVQVFWKIAGMEYSVSTNFRSHQMPAIDWLLMVLNGFKVCIPNSNRVERKKLKPRMKLLDTIWLEDRIYFFDGYFKKRYLQIVWESLTLLSKLTVIGAVSAFVFLSAFFVADIGFDFTFEPSIFVAFVTISVIWAAILLFLLYLWLIECLKWSCGYYRGFYGYLGSVYRFLRPKNNPKKYFYTPIWGKIFRLIVIGVGSIGVFFELKRLNLIYDAVQNPSIYNLYTTNINMAFHLLFQIFLSFAAIWWLYNRMGLFTKKIRRIEQLYYPFTMADYSLDMLLEDKNVVENINAGIMNRLFFWSGISTKNQASRAMSQLDFQENENKIKFCQLVLLELGQEVLAKRADWLLAVTDRDLQTPK